MKIFIGWAIHHVCDSVHLPHAIMCPICHYVFLYILCPFIFFHLLQITNRIFFFLSNMDEVNHIAIEIKSTILFVEAYKAKPHLPWAQAFSLNLSLSLALLCDIVVCS